MLRHLALLLTTCLMSAPAGAETLIVHAGRLITDAAKRPLGPSTITIVDGRITGVAEGHSAVPPGARLIDLSAKTVLPGLIDTHVHLSGEPGEAFWRDAVNTDEYAALVGTKNARLTAKAGFTTVRDVGSPSQVGYALRRGVQENLIPGPRVLSSGPPISIVGGHGDITGFRPEVLEALQGGNTCTGASNAPPVSAKPPGLVRTSSRSRQPVAFCHSRRAGLASISPTPR